MKYVKERWGITVYDPAAWDQEQQFIVVDGAVICNICHTEPRFGGWCSGAATYHCCCGVDQETFERLTR